MLGVMRDDAEQLIEQAEAALRECEAVVMLADSLRHAGIPVRDLLLDEMDALHDALAAKVAEMGIGPDACQDIKGSCGQPPQ